MISTKDLYSLFQLFLIFANVGCIRPCLLNGVCIMPHEVLLNIEESMVICLIPLLKLTVFTVQCCFSCCLLSLFSVTVQALLVHTHAYSVCFINARVAVFTSLSSSLVNFGTVCLTLCFCFPVSWTISGWNHQDVLGTKLALFFFYFFI